MHAQSFEPAPPVLRAALNLLRMTPMSWFSCLDLTSAGVRIVHHQVAWFCPLLLGLKSICNYCSVRKIIESTCVFCFLNTLQASRPNLVSLFVFLQCWRANSGLCTGQASVLPPATPNTVELLSL